MKFDQNLTQRYFSHGLTTPGTIVPNAKYGHTHYIAVNSDFTLAKPEGIYYNELVHMRIILHDIDQHTVTFDPAYTAKGLLEHGLSQSGFNILNYISVNGEVICWLEHDRQFAYNHLRNITTTSFVSNNDEFGSSVALSGDGQILFVGAKGRSTDDGSIYEFRKTALGWSKEPVSTINSFDPNALFGSSITCNYAGTRLVVGMPAETQVATYNRTTIDDVWVKTTTDLTSGSSFGSSVALSGDGLTLLVGRPDSESFSTYTHDAGNSTGWVFLEVTVDTSGFPDSLFGSALAINYDGTIAATTAPEYEEGTTGGVWVFFSETSSGFQWVEISNNFDSDPTFNTSHQDGYSIAMSGGFNQRQNIFVGSTNKIKCYRQDELNPTYDYVGDIVINNSDLSGLGESLAIDQNGEILVTGRPKYSSGGTINTGIVSTFKKIK